MSNTKKAAQQPQPQPGVLSYVVGRSRVEKLTNLYELKHTMVQALFARIEGDLDMQQDPELRHLMRLYHEAHLLELSIINPAVATGGMQAFH